jgi:hypothetical protein
MGAMSNTPIKVTITLLSPELTDEEIQESVQSIRSDLEDIDGVEEVSLIPVEEAPPGAKSIGGFLLNQLKAIIGLDFLKSALMALGQHLYGSPIEIEAEGNGKKLKVRINRPDDLQQVMPDIEKFISG